MGSTALTDPPAFRALAGDTLRIELINMAVAEACDHHAPVGNRAGGCPAAILCHKPRGRTLTADLRVRAGGDIRQQDESGRLDDFRQFAASAAGGQRNKTACACAPMVCIDAIAAGDLEFRATAYQLAGVFVMGVVRQTRGAVVDGRITYKVENQSSPTGGIAPCSRMGAAVAFLVRIRIHVHAHAQLLHVADAGNGAGLFTRFGQRRQQHGRQNRDDGDDDQKFDQGKLQDFFHVVLLGLFEWFE